jgi:GNAT superfamily N-acetyltransferase
MNGRVRAVRPDELDRLLDLYRHLNPEDPDIKGQKHIKELWREICADPSTYYFAVEEDEQLVSSCTLSIVRNLTRGGRPYGLIENVVTHASYRKRGYGSAVLEKAVETARSNGCHKVLLMTGRKEESTLNFYEKAGFKRGLKTAFIMKF